MIVSELIDILRKQKQTAQVEFDKIYLFEYTMPVYDRRYIGTIMDEDEYNAWY